MLTKLQRSAITQFQQPKEKKSVILKYENGDYKILEHVTNGKTDKGMGYSVGRSRHGGCQSYPRLKKKPV